MKSDVQSLVTAMSKLNTMSFGPSHKQVKRVRGLETPSRSDALK